jgi:hypothetical protein
MLANIRWLKSITALFALALAVPPAIEGQQDGTAAGDVEARPEPQDAYRDEATRALMELARQARAGIADGLTSYEGRMWEHLYLGVSGPSFRRERGIIEQERVSRIRWSADGEHIVRWEGARRDFPIAGVTSEELGPAADGIVRDLSGDRSEAAQAQVPPPLSYDPGSDRIAFGGEWALNPLADTAALHYRYRPGDTLSISLPGREERIVLAEVLVEPRRTDFRLLSASLWLDVATGALVRAGYRPARPFDLALDGPEDGDLPPGFLRPIRAEIRYVSVDHGLFDLRWWIPRRFTFEGEAQVAAFARFPIAVEWTLGVTAVNEESQLIPDVMPEGWLVREARLGDEEDEDRPRVTVLIPTVEELVRSDEIGRGGPLSGPVFSEEELRELRRTLDGLGTGDDWFQGSALAWGSQEQLTRYNRVEGLSTGVASAVSFARRLELRGELRYGFSDREVGGELRLARGPEDRREEVAVFRRLTSSSEWSTAGSLGSSLAAVLWGGDHTPFHRAMGGEVLIRRVTRPLTQELRLFVERHEGAERTTHAHLTRLWRDRDFPENPESLGGDWGGAALRLRWETTEGPGRLQAFGSLQGEAAAGTTAYGRGWFSAGATVPLRGRRVMALEVGAGSSVGGLPPQRRFFPGGPGIFRGGAAGEVAGEAFWFATGELGSRVSGIGLVTFVDVLAVASRDRLGSERPSIAVGTGLSLLDGLFRLDLARTVQGGSGWRLLIYSDGLF